MRLFFNVSFLLFLSGVLLAQNSQIEIKGKVITSKKQNALKAELYLKLNDSVYKTITNENGEYKFSVKKSPKVAELYINTTTRTIGASSKRSCFLANRTIYKINLAEKPEPAYDFELKLAGIDYSTPSILFKANSPDVVLDVKYGNTSAAIDEVMEYFYKLTKEYPKMVLTIDGTMSSNEKTDNLSLLRAKYIADLLIKKGVMADKIKCSGRGISLPEITNADIKKAKTKKEEERLHSLNRRVLIKVLTLGEGVDGNRLDDND